MPAHKSAKNAPEEIHGVHVTHPDRVLFAAQGLTKRAVIEYYQRVADLMLPHIVDRPLALVRCPRGAGQECFFQKHANPGWPDDFHQIRIKEKSAARDYLYIHDERGLIAATQMGVLELHVWACHIDRIEQPDRMVFDLDPAPGVSFTDVKDAARDLKKRLGNLGLESFAMVTGGKGIHVVVPVSRRHSWEQHRGFAEALARLMAEEKPERYVANMSKAKRHGKIFIDYLRNQRGATAIAPYSTRSRPGAFVAVPVAWPALSRIEDAHPVSVANAARRLGRGDPWQGYGSVKQSLPLRKLGI